MNKLIRFCDRLIEIGLFILVGAVPLIFDSRGFNPVLIKTTFVHILIFAMFLAWLAKSIEKSKFHITTTPLNLPILLFFFTCVISFFFSEYKYASVKGLSDFFCYIMLFFIVINNVHTIKHAIRILVVFLASSAVVSFYGLCQHFGIDFISWIRGGKVISSMGGSNFLAGYLILVIPVCLGVFFIVKSRLWKILCAVLLSCLILCLSWTFVRSSWLAFLIGLLFFLIFKIKRARLNGFISKRNFAESGILLISIPVIVYIILSAVDSGLFQIKMQSIFPSVTGIAKEIPQMLSKPYEFQSQMGESPGERITIWQGTYRMFLNRPLFGHGVGTFEVSFPEHRPSFYVYKFGNIHTTLHAHSEYLEILSEQGILGLGMFLWVIFVFFKETLKNLKKMDERNFNLALGGICAVLSLVVEGFISVNLRWTSPAVFFWLVISLAVVISKQQVPEPTEIQVSPKVYLEINFTARARQLMYILILITGIFLSANEINLFDSNFHLGRALKFMQAYRRPDVSVTECKESLMCESTNIRALYCLGISYSLQGDWDESKNAYLGVIRLAPYYHQVDYNLGIVYYRLGMIRQSLKHLEKAAELDTSNTQVLKIISFLREKTS